MTEERQGFGAFQITMSRAARAQVVSLRGELDIASAPHVRRALLRADNDAVVIDLSRLAFIDAAGMSAIVLARNSRRSAGLDVQIRGARGIVRRVFELAELGHVLDDAA
jgi:anti-anti-sigma factor